MAQKLMGREAICRKIESIMPEAGTCGSDYTVEYDWKRGAWVVDLKRGNKHLKTFVEDFEAKACLEKDRCIPLGVQVGQLKRNLKLYGKS
ncbi:MULTISPECIES: hypothetical protein [Desulfosediminicola]|uniref:hypothetical protein n=1 Tax=Desulfosediminicola TaxID=2886823 RepID=UPI0010AB6EA6|nr:hypothetical protein [Desulfosediminicola ganghwensis]